MSYPIQPMKQSKSAEQGVALIMALLIVALATTIATVMMLGLERDTHRTMMILETAKAEGYAEGGLLWAEDQLRDDWRNHHEGAITDPTPIHSPLMQEEGYQIAITISSMQNRYNINELTTEAAKTNFYRLLHYVAPALSEEEVKSITQAIVDWIADNQRMVHIGELMLIKGMQIEVYNALAPYVVALPTHVPIDVEVPLAPVLMTLTPRMTASIAMQIVAACHEKPLTSVQAFFGLEPVKVLSIPENRITVISHFFLVETTVTNGKFQYVLRALIERKIHEDTVSFEVVWQERG